MTNADRESGVVTPRPEDVQATFCATLVDEWARAGLTDAVVCPGSRSTPLSVALAADDRVRVHVHHDERSGSFLALGLARVTERPVAIVTTSGTAAVQLHAAVVEADLSAVPLLVCTADRPPEARERAAPQTVDQVHLYGRSVRWYVEPGVPTADGMSWWRSVASRAYVEATGSRAGPVQCNLSFREPLVGTRLDLPPARGDGPWQHRVISPPRRGVLDTDLARARGVVIAGRGTPDPEAVGELADALGWPLFADPASHVSSEGRIAAFDALVRTPFADDHRPEVVLRAGAMPASKELGRWLDRASPVEVVVAEATWLPDPDHRVALALDGVPAPPTGGERVTADWLARWREADVAAGRAIDAVLAEHPLSEPAIARHLTATAPPGAVVVASSSMPVRDVEWFGTPRRDVRVVANRGANGIDGVVSTAVGASLSGARTTLLIGDVAFLHDSNGLLGLADRGVDCTIVVLDNGGGGIFSFLPQRSQLDHDNFEALFGTPHGLDLVALAAAHGVPAARVDTLADLEPGPGVRVLVVAGDRDANVALHETLTRAVTGAVGRGSVGR